MSNDTQIYSARYSNVPVFEFVTSEGPIMRRKSDSWINATHILKIARLPKAKRTRILEKDVQTGIHEKVQGGYGKYQGTYVPLELGEIIARNYDVYEVLKPIFDFKYIEGETATPPPAPKHNHASALNMEKRQAILNKKEVQLLKAQRQPKLKRTGTNNNSSGGESSDLVPARKRGRPKGSTLSSTPSLQHSDTVPIDPSRMISRPGNVQGGAASTMDLKQEDLASVGTDEDDDDDESDRNGAGPGLRRPTLLNGEFETQPDLLTSKELFGVSRHSFEKNNNNHIHPNHPNHPNHHNQHSLTQLSHNSHGHNLNGHAHATDLLQPYHQPSINLSQENQIYIDYFQSLLSYFLEDDGNKVRPNVLPERILNPPQPISKIHINQAIDNDSNTILHWACSMGNLAIIKFLLERFGKEINSDVRNGNGETPLMFLVKFNNCYELGNFKDILNILKDSLILVDANGKTVLHHIVELKKEKNSAYYLEELFNSLLGGQNDDGEVGLSEDRAEFVHKLINHQDSDGNTAFHIVAFKLSKKLIKLFINHHKFINLGLRNLVSCTVEDYLASHNYVLRLDQGSDLEDEEIANADEKLIRQDIIEDNPLRTHSFNAQINNSKIALNLFNNTANELTEKMTQLSYFINQELKEKDELVLTYFKILNRVNEIKLSSQRDILALFKLEHLIDDLQDTQSPIPIKTESFGQESQATTAENIVDTYNLNFEKNQIIQEEIYRLINDLTFQILHKREELLNVLKTYMNVREFSIARDLEQLASECISSSASENENENEHEHGDGNGNGDDKSEAFRLTRELHEEIAKKRSLVNQIMIETRHVPLPPKVKPESNGQNGGPRNENNSIIEKYAADPQSKLIKYCKLISLSCGMKFDEVEQNIDSIEQSLSRK
ncbi:uncharacterized protein LODBEIA_P23250 [Lodderomyces beijingensis]|uniref:HTH APSES-type domain-containing protein n=1 Tax=Lodderomyces beijingensis TaxID=1775926 RepID=A0ABP0ZMJ2_9ASCO